MGINSSSVSVKTFTVCVQIFSISERVTHFQTLLTLVILQVSSALINKSISHSFLEFKFVIRPSLFLYVIFFNCIAVSLYCPLQRAAVRACYVPGCPVHLSFYCVNFLLCLFTWF